MPNAPLRRPLGTAIDLDRRRIGDPNDLAHLVRTPRALIRSQSITRPLAGISDNQHLRAALRTRRNRKGRNSRLYDHLNLPAAARLLCRFSRPSLSVASPFTDRRDTTTCLAESNPPLPTRPRRPERRLPHSRKLSRHHPRQARPTSVMPTNPSFCDSGHI
jgi:hypothetical protein